MVINILGKKGEAYNATRDLILSLGHKLTGSSLSHVAVAPLLTQKLTLEEIGAPLLGTLIFHPSPLPYGRGASAIRWAYRRQEPVTAATWFWANETPMTDKKIFDTQNDDYTSGITIFAQKLNT